MSEQPACGDRSDDEVKRNDGGSGCLVLILFGIPVLDTLGFVASTVGPYAWWVLSSGVGGFACGAMMGARAAKKNPRARWASIYWALYGLGGLIAAAFLALVIANRFLPPANAMRP